MENSSKLKIKWVISTITYKATKVDRNIFLNPINGVKRLARKNKKEIKMFLSTNAERIISLEKYKRQIMKHDQMDSVLIQTQSFLDLPVSARHRNKPNS